MAKKTCCSFPIAYWPAISPSVELINPSFDQGPTLPDANSFTQTDASGVDGWITDATDNKIEIWADGFQGVPAHDGGYFIEMNSSFAARMEQGVTFGANAGVLEYSVWHRQRRRGAAGIESAEVIVEIDGVDTVVAVMDQSSSDSWTNYTGTIAKPCGPTSAAIAFNSLQSGSFGNFLDLVELKYSSFSTECLLGTIDCCGVLKDAEGNVLDKNFVTFCNPICREDSEVALAAVQEQIDAIQQSISGWRCEEVCSVVGYVTVAEDGSIVESFGEGIEVTKTDTGLYEIVPPAGAVTHSINAIEDAINRDGIHIHFASSFTGLTVWLGIGDNGGVADTLVDAPFTIQWFGKKTMVVCDTVSSSEPEDTTGPTLGEPANGALVSDNFQDGNGNAPFNLQVRNTTGNATNWQAVVTGPYATIPSLNAGNYTLQTTDNGDGTYTHVFTGTAQLTAFGNITITGGTPSPAGSGGTANVDLYIP